MALDNADLQTPGLRRGEPLGWRLVARVRSTAIATFDSVGAERFAWSAHVRALGAADQVRAALGGALAETFAWVPGATLDPSLASLVMALLADGAMVERFAPAPLVARWTEVVAAAAQLPDGSAERFRLGWVGTVPYPDAWTQVSSDRALFGFQAAEQFDAAWPTV